MAAIRVLEAHRVLARPPVYWRSSPQVEVRHVPGLVVPEQPTTFHECTRAYQRELLRRELVAQSWNVAAVAKRLDLTRAHVYNLIQQYKLRGEES